MIRGNLALFERRLHFFIVLASSKCYNIGVVNLSARERSIDLMKCPICGKELELKKKQIGTDENGDPILNEYAICRDCRKQWNLDRQRAKRRPQRAALPKRIPRLRKQAVQMKHPRKQRLLMRQRERRKKRQPLQTAARRRLLLPKKP